MEPNYRVVESYNTETSEPIFIMCWVSYDETGKIAASSEPGYILPAATDLDKMRSELHLLTQALEHPVLHLSDLPGSETYVDPDQTADRDVIREMDSSTEAPDDGSAPKHLAPPVEDAGGTVAAEPEGANDDPPAPETAPPAVPVDDLGTPHYHDVEHGGEG